MTALVRAAVVTGRRPSLWVVALCGFLARGGIVLLVLPMLPLPSTVGLATFIGPTSVTAAGLTPDSVVRLVLVLSLGAGWLLGGSVVGALTDIAIVSGLDPRRVEGVGPGPTGVAATHPSRGRLVIRLVGLRLLALLPLAVVVAVTARSIGELVYQELILPSDGAAPIALRVVQGAQVQVAALALAWILGEVLGGIAVRVAILDGRSLGGAFVAAGAHVLRHPLGTLGTTVAGLGVAAVALGLPLVATGLAWAALGQTLSGELDGSLIARSTIVLVGAWLAAAFLAAVVASWRGALWTAEVAGPPSGA